MTYMWTSLKLATYELAWSKGGCIVEDGGKAMRVYPREDVRQKRSYALAH